MVVPSEISKQLDAAPRAHAALSCGLHGPIGETHLVLEGARVLAFTRESLVGAFTRIELAGFPALEKGDFSDTLRLQLDDGTDAELNVSSFERDAVAALLAAAAQPVPPAPPLRVEAPVREVEPHREERTHHRKPPPEPVLPAQPAEEAGVEEEPAEKEKPDRQAGREIAVYHSSDPGLFGCILQLAVFVGAVWAFWHLHTEAARNLGLAVPRSGGNEGFTFIATKALALVAGAYLGVRLVQLVNVVLRGLGLIGKLMFSQSVIQVFGPSGKWHVMFSTPLPIQVTLRCHKTAADAEPNEKPAKQIYNYYLGLSQNGQSALLKTSHHAVNPRREIAGIPVTPVADEPKSERQFGLEYQTFKHVARRIAKLR
jgi:hypothetical protein